MRAPGCHIVGLVLCAVVLAPGFAWAAECAPAVAQAVVDLGDARTGPIAARFCPTEGRVVVRVTPSEGATLDVELGLGAGGFLRGGIFGVSPVLDGDWSAVAPPLRDAVEALAEALQARGGDLARTLAGPTADPTEGGGTALPSRPPGLLPAQSAPPPASWPVLLLLGLAACALGGGRRPREGTLAPLLGLFGVAFALRSALSLFGPFQVNGQGPLWLLGAWGRPELLSSYGPGYPELFTAWQRLAPGPPDRAVFWLNAAISSTLPPLAAALAGTLGAGPRARLLLGAVLAALPIAVLVAASESYYPVIGALLLGGAWALVAAGEAATQRRWRSGALLQLGGGLLLAQAARVHPLAWPLVALAPAVVLAGEGSWRARGLRAAGIGVLAGLLILASSGPGLLTVARGLRASQDSGVLARGLPWTPGAGAVLATLCALLAARSISARALALMLAAIPAVLWALATHAIFAQSPTWHDAYLHTALLLPAAVLVAAVPESALRWRALPWIVGLGLVVGGRPLFMERTTTQLEYAFLAEVLPTLEPGCRVAYIPRAERRLLWLPEHLVPGWDCGTTSGLVVQTPQDVLAGLLPGQCRVLYRSSLCASAEGAARCDAAFAGLSTEEIASALLPARPSYADLPYTQDPVPLALLRVKLPPRVEDEPLRGMRIALTVDDLPFVGRARDGVPSATDRLVATLRSIPTTAFANCDRVDPEGRALRPFLDAGIPLGNHQGAHDDLNVVGAARFVRGARTCHEALTGWLGGPPTYFRYPYLRRGTTESIRDGVRAQIEALPETIAPTTIDNHEWWLAARYAESDDDARRAAIAAAYRAHLRAAAIHARGFAQAKLGRDPVHVVLVHANELNADHLAGVLSALAEEGVTFVPLDVALDDPLYGLPDAMVSVRGVSWLYRVAPPTPPEEQHFEHAAWEELRARFSP